MVNNPGSFRNTKREIPIEGTTSLLICTDIDNDGLGISRWNNWVIAAKEFVPGDKSIIRYKYKKGNRLIGEVIKRIETSTCSVKAQCPIARDCGGCTIQHVDPATQIELKQRRVREAFARIGKLNMNIEKLITENSSFLGYRNRTILPIKQNINKKLELGYYKTGTHEIIDITNCPVLDNRLNTILRVIRSDLEISNINADPDCLLTNGLRHISIRLGHYTNDILVTFISYTEEIAGIKKLARKWIGQNPNIKGITLNIQPDKNNIIFGSKTILLEGKRYIREQFLGLNLKIGTTTFFQINTIQAEKIVNIICEWFVKDSVNKKVLDCFCGIGTISLPLATKNIEVHGIDINIESIIQAKNNAELNGIRNAFFYSGDVSELIKRFDSIHGLVIDPPRKGLKPALIKVIKSIRPQKIAYLSCDVSTLARDLSLFTKDKQYFIERVYPVDFFPQTTHIECLALLRLIRT